MVAFSKNTAAVILCRRNGTILQVLYEDLALSVGERLELLYAPFDRRRAKTFFETLEGRKAVLNRKLTVATATGPIPLYFSGASSGPTVVIVGTRNRFEAAEIPPNLDSASAEHLRRMRIAFQKLDTLRQVRADSAAAAPGSRRIGTTELLRLFAHDVTNPVSGILTASQFLLEDAARVLDPQQCMLLHLIEASSQYVLRFIEGVVELQMVQSRKVQVQLQPVNLGRVVEEAISGYRRRAEGKRIRLESQTVGPPPIVEVDRQRMTQALAALVRNELECQQPGGTLNITVAKLDTSVSITIAREPAVPNGPGGHTALELPSRTPKRGLNEIRTAYTLSAVSKIVEAHRGRIGMEERLEGGPAFVITLPLGARRLSPQKPSPRKPVRLQPK